MDEAKSLLCKAKEILEKNGDLNKAKKLANQAKNLGLVENSDDLLREIDEKLKIKTNSADNVRANPTTDRNRINASDSDEIRQIERLPKINDLYERLGIGRDASEADIRAAYKKLALKYHPDKNSTPGSSEAFKAISQAYSILSDAEKRRSYDNKSLRVNGASENFAHEQQVFNDDFDPNEIFRMFFGHAHNFGGGFGGFGGGLGGFGEPIFFHGNFPRMRRQRRENMEIPRRSLLIQFLPILVFFGASMMMNLFNVSPQYQFTISSNYPNKMTTSRRNVIAYVTDDFYRKYYDRIPRNIEDKIEEDYQTYLANMCYREEQDRYYRIELARRERRQHLIDRANAMELPHCRKLQQFNEKVG